MPSLLVIFSLWVIATASALADLSFPYNSPADIAVTASGYTASGALNLTLHFQPTPGQNLTVVKNTGPAFISGTFDSVAQGSTVPLTYNGVTYNYIANYYGGNGRSLVLHWPLTGLAAWGSNQYGQLGNRGISDQSNPVAVFQRGAMAGAPIACLDAGQNHTLALSTDGRIFSWGDNYGGQLGNGGTQRSNVPVAVDHSGLLAGRTIVAVSGGGDYSLALDSGGLIYSWGDNTFGNLGNGGVNPGYTYPSSVPVAVDTSGVLNGKTLTAIAAGNRHALALSSEGKVYSWGTNSYGSLGNNSAIGTGNASSVPVAVDTSGVLADKAIVAIDADYHTNLALSADGRVFSWGYNAFKQLGNGGTTNSPVPVAVDVSGAMAGKFIVAIAVAQNRSLALSSDGKIYTWGTFIASDTGAIQSGIPVEVNTGSVLVGKTVVAISARSSPCTVLTSDGLVFVWQQDATSGGLVPLVGSGDLAGRFVSAITDGVELLNIGPPEILRHPWSRTLAEGQTATFTAMAGNEFPSTVQWQVSPTGPAGPFTDITGNPTATTGTLSIANISAVQDGHAFRAVFTNASGSQSSQPALLTVVAWSATLTSATSVPFTGDTIAASGNLNLQLGFAPATGTDLKVIQNRGTEFISGTFANVPQGGTVSLIYNSVTYDFIADYYGENGRSLVLHWSRTRLMAWGQNQDGTLGIGDSTQHLVPAEVVPSSGMSGKITKLAASGGFSMALTADGRVFTWGSSSYGRLGTNTTTPNIPAEVTATGALAGKTVVAISASGHCLALTSEGRVYAWGSNGDRQLGIGSTASSVPSPVELLPEAFDGQAVVAISAGGNHSMALTADGRIFSWGSNSNGKTGNGATASYTLTPTEVITSESLKGVTIVAIAAGSSHSLAMASDGSLFAWGDPAYTGTNSPGLSVPSPKPVVMSGELAGKIVARIDAAGHSLVLTTDGNVFGWGSNYAGQLGTGTTTTIPLPVAINGGALAGKMISSISCGSTHSAVTTTEGDALTWGKNDAGQLGDGTTTNRTLPVAVATLGGSNGLKTISMATGGSHTLALVDAGPPRILTQPYQRTAAAGADVTFTASATDPFGYSVKWQVSPTGSAGPFVDITNNASASTTTLVINAVSAAQDQSAYRAVFYNTSGSSNTSPAVLNIVEWSGIFNAATDIPNQAEGPIASGPLDLHLNFAPTPGTSLNVLQNTGLPLIDGTFENVPQGGRISLDYNGVTYEFIANYFGGNGRSLVLQWPWMKIAAAGANNYSQLGQANPASSSSPVIAPAGAWSSGRSILAIAAGANHNLAVMSDGRLAAWGRNSSSQLGNNSSASSAIPVDVVSAGAMAGEIVVATAAGDSHSLALTQSGRVFAWGLNSSGQLGDESTTKRTEPVAVAGLSGQKIVAIAAGAFHNLALTERGTIYAWGAGSYGQLGNKSSSQSPLAVPVDSTGALAGKVVIAIAAGDLHSLALTADGQVFAWGSNGSGRLGNAGITNSSTPLAVDPTSGLAGKTVVGIAAGSSFSLARTSDGKLFAWGSNTSGQFGSSTPASSQVPVEIAPTGARIGKSIQALSVGTNHSLAVTTTGELLTWGSNTSGQLGAGNTTNQPSPVAVLTAAQAASGGAAHSIALIAGASAPEVTLNPVSKTLILADAPGLTLQFSAAAFDVFPFTVRWQESASGPAGPFSDIVGNPSATTPTLVLANISPSLDGHAFRAVFTNSVASSTSAAASLNVITPPDPVHFSAATDIPLSVPNPALAGALNVTLGFAPVPGVDLTLVRNTGSAFISGSFSNLIQGATVPLSFAGVTHSFIVDHFGGNGRSLVLHWANNLPAAWGLGASGQVGAGINMNSRPTSVAVFATGVMAGQTVVKLAAGTSHSLALTSSGRIFAWGSNASGMLGNGSTASSNAPVEVDATGELAGKRVVAIAAGDAHSLALTADGQIASWGSNSNYILGNGGTASSSIPVAVSRAGVLAGKTVTAIAAGKLHNVALTSDGTLVAWGSNSSGQLGNGTNTNAPVPVAVTSSGVLAGKTVVAIAAGNSHTLALTADGRVFSWGSNQYGLLGTGSGSPASSNSPVAISGGGLIAGKTVIAIAAGASHNLAITSDGMVYAWGLGSQGQLGNGNNTLSYDPVAVSTSGVLAGKTVVAISAGGSHSLAIDSDGHGYAWGLNSTGQLGNNSASTAYSPVEMSTLGIIGSRPLVAIAAGGSHSLAFAGKGTAPTVNQSPVSLTVAAGSTVTFTAAADGYPAPTMRWQQSLTGPGGSFSNLSSQSAPTMELTNVTASQTGYAYRAVFTNLEASTNSAAATLTVQPTFASFLISRGLSGNAPPLDDPFQTGINHLLAYAFNLDPTAPDWTKLPSATSAGGHLQISYTRWKNAIDHHHTVEVSNGLGNWLSGPGVTEIVSVTSLDNARETVIEQEILTDTTPARFLRVRVELDAP